MLPLVRTLGVSRLAALAVALGLSGAPQVVAARTAPAGGRHVCRCGAHGPEHDCGCPRCHATREADLEGQPPCHRAAARKALAGERRREESGRPCLKGSCGVPEAPRAIARTVGESFTLAQAPPLARPASEEAFFTELSAPPDRAVAPESPPPRSA